MFNYSLQILQKKYEFCKFLLLKLGMKYSTAKSETVFCKTTFFNFVIFENKMDNE